jgi:hypothetical protein
MYLRNQGRPKWPRSFVERSFVEFRGQTDLALWGNKATLDFKVNPLKPVDRTESNPSCLLEIVEG